MIDANLDRAAEGLRVVEDVCRFGWGQAGLAAELKALRHELLEAGRGSLAEHRRQTLARDAEGDVGRRGGVEGPTGRPAPASGGEDSLLRAAVANNERAREALRVLEEAVRGDDAARAGRFEAIRYRLYSLEKVLWRVGEPGAGPGRLDGARLCVLLTGELCALPFERTAGAILEAGVDLLQLREKRLGDRELLERARWLRERTARAGALLVIDDRPDIARLSRADGVHLGQGDLPVAEAREVAGGEVFVGVSTHSREEARRAVREGADYVGLGPAYASATKAAGEPLGPRAVAEIAASVPIPAFAIGGIGPSRARELAAAGAGRIAVSSAVIAVPDPGRALRGLRAELEESSRPSPGD